MPLDLRQNRGPIDEMDGTFRDVLEDLQGNILKGHGRFNAVHVFVHFNEHRIDDVKRWISKFAQRRVTSAWQQIEEAIAYRADRTDAGVFGHFALSAAGYKALGFDEDQIPRGADPRNRGRTPPALAKVCGGLQSQKPARSRTPRRASTAMFSPAVWRAASGS